MADLSNVRVNGQRLWDALMEMAKIGATPKGGCKRLTLTDLDKQGRELFRAARRKAAQSKSTTWATCSRPGPARRRLAPVLMGSHLDTQPTGGKFDGVLGVLGALEVMRSLNAQDQDRRPIMVANWTNEEGSRFAPAMVSSGVFAGVYTKEFGYSRVDAEGKTLGDELKRIGFAGRSRSAASRSTPSSICISSRGRSLRTRTRRRRGHAWPGAALVEIRLTGFESHAGSTPMPRRKDALLGAARIVERVNQIGLSKAPLGVSTVGMLNPYPNSRNVIPGEVFMACEFRHPDRLDAIGDGRGAARRRGGDLRPIGLTYDLKQVFYYPPVAFDEECVAAVRAAAQHFGYRHRDIVSGAGHDACYLARVCPTSMIFTPAWTASAITKSRTSNWNGRPPAPTC